MKELIEKIKNIEIDDKTLLTIVLCAAVFIYLDYSFILKAQTNAIKSISPKISKIKIDLDNFNRDYAAMSKMPAQAVQEKKEVNLKKVVEESNIASLLQDISDIANKNDIKIIQLKPNKELLGLKDKIPGMEKLTPMTITLDMTGGYHQLGKFIDALEYGPNFIAVQEMKISSQPADFFKQKINLVLKTYVKK
ncbi:MAG: type 4a pilus biogenesis protein PilO [Candidatus Omnitrophica bacterium]|nr:type 4a pilus biogenesis protein PilO [Candidatus Omnitrophota bacterium]